MIKRNLLLLLCMGMIHMGTCAIEQENTVIEQKDASEQESEGTSKVSFIVDNMPSMHYIPAAIIAFVGSSGLAKMAYELRHEKNDEDEYIYPVNSWGDLGLEIVESARDIHILWTAVALGYAVKHKKYAYVPGLLTYFSMMTSIIPFTESEKFYAGSILLAAGYMHECYKNEHKRKTAHVDAINDMNVIN